MTEQQWTIWEPVQCLENVYDLDRINFNIKGLSIYLSKKKQEYQTVEILFKNSIVAYTNTDESFILELPGNLKQIYEAMLPSRWTFFKIINSRYIERLAERINNRITDRSNWIHFVLFTRNEMIDIVANYEPEVTIKNWDIPTLMLLYKERILPIIVRYFPTAKIILYGSRSQGKIIKEKYGVDTIKIAIDIGQKIHPALMKALDESICYEAAVRIPVEIVDFHAVQEELRQQIIKEGIDWAKEKNI